MKFVKLSDILFAIALFLVLFISSYLIISALISCGPMIDAGDTIYQKAMDGKGCEPVTFDCLKNKLMICNASHDWEVDLDCDNYETPRSCCEIGGRYSCYRPYECQEVRNDTAE